jgi:hypothetical protein
VCGPPLRDTTHPLWTVALEPTPRLSLDSHAALFEVPRPLATQVLAAGFTMAGVYMNARAAWRELVTRRRVRDFRRRAAEQELHRRAQQHGACSTHPTLSWSVAQLIHTPRGWVVASRLHAQSGRRGGRGRGAGPTGHCRHVRHLLGAAVASGVQGVRCGSASPARRAHPCVSRSLMWRPYEANPI